MCFLKHISLKHYIYTRLWLCWCIIIELSYFGQLLSFLVGWCCYLHLLHYFWQIDVRTLEGCFYFWNVGIGGKVYQKLRRCNMPWKTILNEKSGTSSICVFADHPLLYSIYTYTKTCKTWGQQHTATPSEDIKASSIVYLYWIDVDKNCWG